MTVSAQQGNRKFVVVIAVLAATFVLGLVLIFARPQVELAAHITGMWSYTVGTAAGAFGIANAVEHYVTAKGNNNATSNTTDDPA